MANALCYYRNVRYLATLIIAAWFCIYAMSRAAAVGDLGARLARQKIAQALGLESADSVRIKSISEGPGGQAVVEAIIQTAFRMTKDKSGDWAVVEARAGDRQWESIELMRTAIRKEKIERTKADMMALLSALEEFRRDNGSYVEAQSGAQLVDRLAPRYLKKIIRLDAWSREFYYSGSRSSYRLKSAGPDGKLDTEDDIVIEDGKFIRSAAP
jgi:hypothetical protein